MLRPMDIASTNDDDNESVSDDDNDLHIKFGYFIETTGPDNSRANGKSER